MRIPHATAGYPIHPMLVPVSLGLWIFSLVCDGFYLLGSADMAWRTLAFYSMAGGIVAALAAAVVGMLEMPSLPPHSKTPALAHVAIGVAAAGLYALNLWQRAAAPDNIYGPVFLSALGVFVLAVSGWLGGHMAYVGEVAADVADDAVQTRMSPHKSR